MCSLKLEAAKILNVNILKLFSINSITVALHIFLLFRTKGSSPVKRKIHQCMDQKLVTLLPGIV